VVYSNRNSIAEVVRFGRHMLYDLSYSLNIASFKKTVRISLQSPSKKQGVCQRIAIKP